MSVTAWIKILIALISLALLINNANKVKEFITPGNSTVNIGANPTAQKGYGILDNFITWLSDETSINQYTIPNWAVLLGGIVFLFALFRR